VSVKIFQGAISSKIMHVKKFPKAYITAQKARDVASASAVPPGDAHVRYRVIWSVSFK
jgi:hypothetical protein